MELLKGLPSRCAESFSERGEGQATRTAARVYLPQGGMEAPPPIVSEKRSCLIRVLEAGKVMVAPEAPSALQELERPAKIARN